MTGDAIGWFAFIFVGAFLVVAFVGIVIQMYDDWKDRRRKK